MKKIILTLITLLALNVTAQEIHSNGFYQKYKKNINKLESFLTEQGYNKEAHDIWYPYREDGYNYVFSKDSVKIFIIIPPNNSWIDPMSEIDGHLADYFLFTNKLKTFVNDNKDEIYIIKRG